MQYFDFLNQEQKTPFDKRLKLEEFFKQLKKKTISPVKAKKGKHGAKFNNQGKSVYVCEQEEWSSHLQMPFWTLRTPNKPLTLYQMRKFSLV